MKPCVLRPKAREDRRSEVRYYRSEAGARVAGHLVDALSQALEQMGRNPAMGSPTLGQELRVTGLRTWGVRGFPLTFWYFEREAHVDVARLVGQRQDALAIEVPEV